MKGFAFGFSFMNVPSNWNFSTPAALPLLIVRICCAMTESTSTLMRLNSSKQHQDPQPARPLKNLAMAL